MHDLNAVSRAVGGAHKFLVTTLSSGAGAGEGRRAASPLCRVPLRVGGAHSHYAVKRCRCRCRRRQKSRLAVAARAVARWCPHSHRCQAVPVPVLAKAEEPPRRCVACRCALAVPTVTPLSNGAGAICAGEGRRAASPLRRHLQISQSRRRHLDSRRGPCCAAKRHRVWVHHLPVLLVGSLHREMQCSLIIPPL